MGGHEKNGLLDNSELVESQTIGTILAWSESAGVDVKGTRTGRPSKDGNFIIITYDFNLEAPMASLSRLLGRWKIAHPASHQRSDHYARP